MNSSLIVAEKKPIIKHNQNEEIRKLIDPYWGLFNRLSIVQSNDNDDVYIVMYANRNRTGNITYYKEVNYIISNINKMLGGNESHLSELDKLQISEGNWKGKHWQSNFSYYWLRFNSDTGRIGLQIGPIK